ncbi:hypothetical protein [Pseudonocardia sp.]|uniref:hypothetical protein n=1 Tax=Pseudonocardia sp. TaxID=60912 RepID=UPI003D0FB93B
MLVDEIVMCSGADAGAPEAMHRLTVATIPVRYFAAARAATGRDEEPAEIEEGACVVERRNQK